MPNDNLEIRPFDADMQDDVASLITAGLTERWGSYDPSYNPDLLDIANHYQNDEMVVAVLGSQVVGAGALLEEAPNTGRIVRMSVKKAQQKSGIGKKILKHLEIIAIERGYESVVLETTETWLDAIQFYESQGYELQEYRDGDAHFSKRMAI